MSQKNNRTTDAGKCVFCHKCRDNCTFLSKYQIDIGDVSQLEKLAYHCFLCGKCTEVCPIGIDGREIILNMRRDQVEKNRKSIQKDYGMILAEKKDYLFKNYRKVSSGSVLFPGCNFPSFYPKTMKKLVKLLRDQADIGVVYDCCGKPVAELGMEETESRIAEKLEERLRGNGVTEIITMCPNCYSYLKPRISVPVVNIYEKLKELGLGKKIPGGCHMFRPCPDRECMEWLEDIEWFLEKECKMIEDVQCCGLGGCAVVKEPGLAKGFASVLKEQTGDTTYVYCASCAGNLTRNGCTDVQHVLAEILDTHERPDTSKSLINRMKTKFA